MAYWQALETSVNQATSLKEASASSDAVPKSIEALQRRPRNEKRKKKQKKRRKNWRKRKKKKKKEKEEG